VIADADSPGRYHCEGNADVVLDSAVVLYDADGVENARLPDERPAVRHDPIHDDRSGLDEHALVENGLRLADAGNGEPDACSDRCMSSRHGARSILPMLSTAFGRALAGSSFRTVSSPK
jgi:hypothetical protein